MVLACFYMPAAIAKSTGQEAGEWRDCAGPENSMEIVLPLEMQANLFHSLPIAGLLVSPDSIAQLVLMNPRLRATTGQPSSGMGTAYPIDESSVVDTHADRSD